MKKSQMKGSILENSISIALDECNRKVYVPYNVLMKVVGWTKIFERETPRYRFLNYLYSVTVIAIIVLGFIIEWLTCYYRFIANTGKDREYATMEYISFENATVSTSVVVYSCKKKLVSRFAAVDILHLAAYIYSFWTWRFAEPEQSVALMDEVFLFAKISGKMVREEAKIIKKMRFALLGTIVWVLLSTVSDAMHLYAHHDNMYTTFIHPTPMVCIILVFSLSLLNMVYAVTVLNYSIICRLLKCYIQLIVERVRESSITPFFAMQKCRILSEFLMKLNRTSGIAVSIIFVNLTSFCIMGIVSVTTPFLDGNMTVLMYTTTLTSVVLWLALMAAPIVFAASLTSQCSKLTKLGNEIRTLKGNGDLLSLSVDSQSATQTPPADDHFSPHTRLYYQAIMAPEETSAIQTHEHDTETNRMFRRETKLLLVIDSFASSLSSLKLSAKILLLPVRSGYVLSLTVILCLTLLLLSQLDVLDMHIANNNNFTLTHW